MIQNINGSNTNQQVNRNRLSHQINPLPFDNKGDCVKLICKDNSRKIKIILTFIK